MKLKEAKSIVGGDMKEPTYFLLFAGDYYYPCASEDYKGCFDTYEEALKERDRINCDWFYILSVPNGEIIHSGDL